MTRFLFTFPVLFILATALLAAEKTATVTHKNIAYYPESELAKADDYQKNQCVVDVFAPENAKNLPVVVWFHGGGLTGGQKEVPKFLKKEPYVLVAVGYRLSPKAKFPEFLEDAAAAVAWAFRNIEQYGGDSKKIFVGGYSAGGYLSGMIGMDSRWLKKYNLSPNDLAGLVLSSAQVTTHFHVKELLGYSRLGVHPVVDEYAPLFYLSESLPPMLFVLGDRKIEWPLRVEENELMATTLKKLGHKQIEFYENSGYDHGTLGNTNGDFAPEAAEQIRNFLKKHAQSH